MLSKMIGKVFVLVLFYSFYSCISFGSKQVSKQENIQVESRLVPKTNIFYPYSQKILTKYVQQGVVNYKAIQTDPEFPKALDELSRINPDLLKTKNEKLAFWMNVYNMYTISAIVKKYPVKSINDLHFLGSLYLGIVLNKTVWDSYFFEISQKKYNLTQVEHEILRKECKDFRIHAAIVCAAKSCPPLRSEIYHPEFVELQLDNQMKIFLGQKEKNDFDSEKNILYLSKIFDWFEKDFVSNEKSLLESLEPYMPSEWKEKIRTKKPKIEYTEYDWSLNE